METGYQNYGERDYSRLGRRFISVDPLTGRYPELTTYQYASNNPVALIDIDGKEGGWELSTPKHNLAMRFEFESKLPPKRTNNAATSGAIAALKPVHSESIPVVVQQARMRAQNADKLVNAPTPEGPVFRAYTPPTGDRAKAMEQRRVASLNVENGLQADGSKTALTKLAESKTFNNFNNNIFEPLMVLDGVYGAGRVGGTALLKSFGKGISSEGTFVYRAIRADEAQSIQNGLGISAKNSAGVWTLEEHLIHGSSARSWMNDPWISTTTDLKIAKSFNSGNGIIRIDLSKIPSEAAVERGFEIIPRSSPAYHYSIWQQETSIKVSIPNEAIKVLKNK